MQFVALNLAVVGATGAVGREMLAILEERNFAFTDIGLFASSRTAGGVVSFKGAELVVQELTEKSLDNYDIALFSAGGGTSLRFSPIAAAAGCIVIDNSSAFRMDPSVPLVVPEVNPGALQNHKGIIANPNCSTIQMVVALKPLHDVSPITRIIVSTYQAVSGTGQGAIDELLQQSGRVLSGGQPNPEVYPHQIAFNVIPQIDTFLENGFTKEEIKMVNETKKILFAPDIKINATTIRVPVVRGHSESVYIETQSPIGSQKARVILSGSPGVIVVDEVHSEDTGSRSYPMPLDAAGKDGTFVGRIRDDLDDPCGLSLWVVSDNLRKGAALNAVQIAELLVNV